MLRIGSPFIAVALLLSGSFFNSVAKADIITVGTFQQYNALPFGRPSIDLPPSYLAGYTYQQVYASKNFSKPVKITEISFASGLFNIGIPGTAIYNFDISLSSTSSTPSNPNSIFDVNKGTDFTVVYSGTLTANLSVNDQFDLIIPLSSPFVFDPNKGNLLLDVFTIEPMQFSIQEPGPGTLAFLATTGSTDVGRVFAFDSGKTGTSSGGTGLVTRFAVTPVPEPATMILLGTGLAGIGAAVRKKRKAKVE